MSAPTCIKRKCANPVGCALAADCLIKLAEAEAPEVPKAEVAKALERQKRLKIEVEEVIWMGEQAWIIKMLDGEEIVVETEAPKETKL